METNNAGDKHMSEIIENCCQSQHHLQKIEESHERNTTSDLDTLYIERDTRNAIDVCLNRNGNCVNLLNQSLHVASIVGIILTTANFANFIINRFIRKRKDNAENRSGHESQIFANLKLNDDVFSASRQKITKVSPVEVTKSQNIEPNGSYQEHTSLLTQNLNHANGGEGEETNRKLMRQLALSKAENVILKAERDAFQEELAESKITLAMVSKQMSRLELQLMELQKQKPLKI